MFTQVGKYTIGTEFENYNLNLRHLVTLMRLIRSKHWLIRLNSAFYLFNFHNKHRKYYKSLLWRYGKHCLEFFISCEEFSRCRIVDQVHGSRKIALTQASEMQQTTIISINLIQPEPDYKPWGLVRSIQQPSYLSLLGSCKSHPTDQQNMGQHNIDQLLMSVSVLPLQIACG